MITPDFPSFPTDATLSPSHRKVLAAGGIGEGEIASRGYVTLAWNDTASALYAFLKDANAPRLSHCTSQGETLVIPVRDLHGTVVSVDVRPDTAPVDADGDTLKYLRPYGRPARVDFGAYDPSAPVVWITEGVKKADALKSVGLSAIALPGVTMWGSREKGLNECMRSIDWAGREVVACFDADWNGGADGSLKVNKNVRKQLRSLTSMLIEHGASVSVAVLPGSVGDVSGLKGVDDHIAAGMPLDALNACVTDRDTALRSLKPRADVTSAKVATDWLRGELGRGELAGLFRRNGKLVHTPRVGKRGYVPPSDEESKSGVDFGPAQVQPVTVAHVKAVIDARYDVGRVVVDKRTKAETWTGVQFPHPPAESAFHAASLGVDVPHVRDITSITHTPAMRPDGTVQDAPGYDSETGFLYLPPKGLTMPTVPDAPTRADVDAARDLILTPVRQFCFRREVDRANWVGLMFTPIMRGLLPPAYPMGMLTATNPGSGKTLLAALLSTVHGGTTRGEVPREKEEIEKVLAAVLHSTTAPVVIFDNVRGTLKSGPFEALLTGSKLTDRLLGQTAMIELTNDRLWMLTGNNLAIDGDLARRVVRVELDPAEADPHLRTGFDLNPAEWMDAHRGEYLAALLTVARGWVVAGKPTVSRRSDSFARWESGIAGMLAWMGGLESRFMEPDPEAGSTVSDDDREWGAFLEAVYRVFPDKSFEAREVVKALQSNHLSPDVLPAELADAYDAIRTGSGVSFTKSLGRWFANRDGRFCLGWKSVKRQSGKKTATYTVHPPLLANEVELFTASAAASGNALAYSDSFGPAAENPFVTEEPVKTFDPDFDHGRGECDEPGCTDPRAIVRDSRDRDIRAALCDEHVVWCDWNDRCMGLAVDRGACSFHLPEAIEADRIEAEESERAARVEAARKALEDAEERGDTVAAGPLREAYMELMVDF